MSLYAKRYGDNVIRRWNKTKNYFLTKTLENMSTIKPIEFLSMDGTKEDTDFFKISKINGIEKTCEILEEASKRLFFKSNRRYKGKNEINT